MAALAVCFIVTIIARLVYVYINIARVVVVL
jgi:hypothetical protein